MFVEKLSKKQITNYLKNVPGYDYVEESDIEISITLNGYILFSVTVPKDKTKIFTATDTYIISESNNWGKYLYSVFGEDYKNWYKKKLEEEFEEIFN